MQTRLMWILAGLAAASFTVAARAQDTGDFPVLDGQSEQVIAPLLTVDIEQLFSRSEFGQRIAQEYNDERETLATENRRIADALREEELALTAQRSTMAPSIFRSEAEAFDVKAQAIRRAQDAKAAALDVMLSDGREQFLNVTRPVLGQLMVDYGAVAILDRRSVLLSLSSVDITDDAVARIDATIGDGLSASSQTTPTPENEPEGPAETTQGTAPDLMPDN